MARMDDVRIGRILRALRRRRGWTQRGLGVRVGLSQQAISLIERGHGGRLAGDTLRRVFAALDARWEGTVSWRGGDLDRLVDAEHARLVAAIVHRLRADGWEVAVEVTYSEFGERGSIDVLGGRADVRAIVVVEVKADFTVVEATLRKLDEKVRLVRRVIGRRAFGWQADVVGRLLVLPASDTAWRRVRAAGPVLEAALPARGVAVRRWLRSPVGDCAGVLFVADTNRGGDTWRRGGPRRIRPARASVTEARGARSAGRKSP
jgi:transcriptional regulator with XRE-family HTH domain